MLNGILTSQTFEKPKHWLLILLLLLKHMKVSPTVNVCHSVTHTYIRTYACTHTYTHRRTRTRIHAHTHTHTYIHTHTHTYKLSISPPCLFTHLLTAALPFNFTPTLPPSLFLSLLLKLFILLSLLLLSSFLIQLCNFTFL